MIMKRILTMVLILCLSITLAGCLEKSVSLENEEVLENEEIQENEKAVFRVSDYDIWITTPSDWEEAETDNLDLQLENLKADMILSAYGYYKIDMAEGQQAQDLFEEQNELILSRRDHVTELEPMTSMDDTEKTIYSALYSAERSGSKNYYNFFFIDFKHTDSMVWILFTGIPSSIEKNRDGINDIISKVQDTNPLDTPSLNVF